MIHELSQEGDQLITSQIASVLWPRPLVHGFILDFEVIFHDSEAGASNQEWVLGIHLVLLFLGRIERYRLLDLRSFLDSETCGQERFISGDDISIRYGFFRGH